MESMLRFEDKPPGAAMRAPLMGSSTDGEELDLPPPLPTLTTSVVVPVRNEEQSLPRLLAALAVQQDEAGARLDPTMFEVILLLNNCMDGSAAVARAWQRRVPFPLHFAERELPPAEAHVGRARRMLFDAAYARLPATGLILTTDADSAPAPDWLWACQQEVQRGVEGVGGRVLLFPVERAALPAPVRRLFLLDIGYRRALEHLRHLYAPEAHDPFPRHHQHFGASFAITARAYGRTGGLPPVPTSEDVALYHALLRVGGRFRHSLRARVFTSARFTGRARGGLADAFVWWQEQNRTGTPILVESARHAQQRLHQLGQWRARHNSGLPPLELLATPEPAPPGHVAELQATVHELRLRCARLAALPLTQRLALSSL